MALATLVIIFGRQIESWMISNARHELRHIVLFLWRMARWAVRFGNQHHRPHRSLSLRHQDQGALVHGASRRNCFGVRLVFHHAGIRNLRHADCQLFHVLRLIRRGIATLVWLYITSFSALLGAELNGVLFRQRQEQIDIPSDSDRTSTELPS